MAGSAPTDRIATAYHEAGHYLMCRLLQPIAPGIEIAQLSIEPDGSSMGRLQVGFDCVPGSTSTALGFPPAASSSLEKALILIFLAGREAQWLGTQKRPVRGHLEDWIEARIRTIRLVEPDAVLDGEARTIGMALTDGDWARVKQVLSELSRRYPLVRQALHRFQREARDLIAQHRDALEALANALLDRGSLASSEAGAVLAPFVTDRDTHASLHP